MAEFVADVLPWLAAFYLLDAIVQLRRGQVVFAREGFGDFTVLRGGLHAAALSPHGAAVFSHELPFLPGEGGVWLFDADARSAAPVIRPEALRLVPWGELGAVRAERTAVRAGKDVIFRARTPAGARLVAAQLEALRVAKAKSRDSEVARALAAALDGEAARALWEKVRWPLAWSSVLGLCEAVILFVGLPYAAFASSYELRWEWVLGALLVAHLGAVVTAGWTLRRAGAPSGEVAATAAVLAIFPAYAARASAQVLRDAFLDWEPVAIAAALLPQEGWMRLARQEWIRIDESEAATRALDLQPYWAARRAALERLFTREGVSPASLTAAPALSDPAAAWCPLCLCEYRGGFERCADCGVPLRSRDGTPALRSAG